MFVGAKDRMEMEKVPQAGYEIEGLWITGIQRKLTLANLMFPIKLISSLMKAGKILANFKPDVVIGTGGFASGPLLRVASRRGIPCVLQEQNSFAGVTNKLLSRKAAKICVAFDGMEKFFPADKIVKTGNPVRENLVAAKLDNTEALRFFGLAKDKPTLLVLGGSLGARRINGLVGQQLEFFSGLGLQVIWQCGKLYMGEYDKYASNSVKVVDYLDRMDLAYSAADIIISRAGAGSVSELCIVGKPTLFIPSPNVAEDHQTKNAQALAREDAALMIQESDLDLQFQNVFSALFKSQEKQRTLGMKMKKLALPNATVAIADEIVKLLQ